MTDKIIDKINELLKLADETYHNSGYTITSITGRWRELTE